MASIVAAFGPGALYVTRTDIANSTPVNIGYAQELTVDLNYNFKELFGQNQFPLVTARSTAKASGKIKAATISGLAWNTVFFGQSFAPGALLAALGEAGSVPAESTYTITVSHSADYVSDLGVLFANTGLPLIKVASAPAAGQYSEAAGTYTFNSAQASAAVLISYLYDTNGASGQTLSVQNELIGDTPTFKLNYVTTLNGNTYSIVIYQCIGTKLTQAFKLEDFMLPEFDFSFFQADNGKIIDLSFPNVS